MTHKNQKQNKVKKRKKNNLGINTYRKNLPSPFPLFLAHRKNKQNKQKT